MNMSRGSSGVAQPHESAPAQHVEPADVATNLASLVVDLQARGLRVEVPLERRQGGAGPTRLRHALGRRVPGHRPHRQRGRGHSPYVLQGRGRRIRDLPRDGSDWPAASAPAAPTLLRPHHRRRHPVLEDRPAAPGLLGQHRPPDLRLLGQRRPVPVLRDRRLAWTRVGRSSRRRPEQLAEVAVGGQGARRRRRRDADDRQLQRRRPGRALRRPMRPGGQGGHRPAGGGAVRAARRPRRHRPGRRLGHRLGRHPRRVASTLHVLAHVAPAKARTGIDAYFRAWERAVARFGEGQVSTYVILGMGEDPELTVAGMPAGHRHRRLPLRRAAAAGRRQPDGRTSCRRSVSTPNASTAQVARLHGRSGHGRQRAEGRLHAMPGLFGHERRPDRSCRSAARPMHIARAARRSISSRSGAHLADASLALPRSVPTRLPAPGRLPAGRSRPKSTRPHFAIRHRVFVEEQAIFAGSDRDVHDERDVGRFGLARLSATGSRPGTVRLFDLEPAAGHLAG